MKYAVETTARFAKGLSLIEIMIAIGILAVSMMLIAAAFPAGVAMSIAVSDETTSQAVFEEAISVIQDEYSVSKPPTGTLNNTEYKVISDDDIGGSENRKFGTTEIFSWSALIRQMEATGPMGNLCQVIIVVSRQPSGSLSFDNNGSGTSTIPELCSVNCTGTADERMLTIADAGEFDSVPSAGYIIDSQTGAIYSIISRNEGPPSDTVTLLTALPNDISPGRDFWVVPGPYDGSYYSQSSPAVRVFNAMLYLP